MKKLWKVLKIGLIAIVALLIVLLNIYFLKVRIPSPDIEYNSELSDKERNEIGSYQYKLGNNLLKKNQYGLWEMYLEGNPYDRGLAFGRLAYELNVEKEEAFINEIRNKVPSEGFLNFLKYLVAWINRDLDDYINQEYLEEIYGSSKSMSDKFDFVGPKFHRILNYHAAHDIGHALQNMNLVGCTSFSVWDEQTDSSNILIGRNFDFYFGQEFAKDKIIAFYNPDDGYKFASVTWACFSGVVSGMNEKGLTITLNSAKSAIPLKGKTPVSIIAREILQYASNIEEAFAVAQQHESFVSETFLIGSREDGKVALIEKSQEETALYYSDTSRLVVTNHFQSDELINSEENVEYRSEGVSDYRYERVNYLLDSINTIGINDVAHIMRDRKGLNNDVLGMGNEKAINQLIAHHSVIFAPNELKIWVSASPYALGSYVGYDLHTVFSDGIQIDSVIEQSPFLESESYANYEVFLQYKEQIQNYLFRGGAPFLSDSQIQEFVRSNPESYLTYYFLADYLKEVGQMQKAKEYYQIGLTKNIARTSERTHMENGLSEVNEQLLQ